MIVHYIVIVYYRYNLVVIIQIFINARCTARTMLS